MSKAHQVRITSTNEAASALCRAAVTRALLLSAACGSLSLACHSAPAAPVAKPGKPSVPVAKAPAKQAPLERPMLRSDVPSVRSTDRFAPIPCAQPRPSDAEYAALNARGDEERAAWDRDREAREYDFRGRNMVLTRDVDSLEIMRAMLSGSFRHTDNSLPIAPMLLAKVGKPCQQANDVAQCTQRLEQARAALFAELKCKPEGECPEFDFTYALITRGDEVHSFRTDQELLALLGAIDTPHEAWVWLNVHKLAENIPCDMPDYAQHRRTDAGIELAARTVTSRCNPFTEKVFTYRVRADGTIDSLGSRVVFHDAQQCVVSGRRPAGLSPFRTDERQSAGQLFAHMAYLEAASVVAFAQLEHDLCALGAPAALLREVRDARDDEVRHAQQMGALAELHAHTIRPSEAQLVPPRSALVLALENAVEGCVRELFGALVARFQAERAAASSTRATLSQIADDEAVHAALAVRLAAWLETKLDDHERDRVTRARADALTALQSELFEPSEAQRTLCGMPSLLESQLLFAELTPLSERLAASCA